MTAAANQQVETIQESGALTYHSEESGYSVARLKAPGHKDLITIVGSFANIQAGQTLKLVGFCVTIRSLDAVPSHTIPGNKTGYYRIREISGQWTNQESDL